MQGSRRASRERTTGHFGAGGPQDSEAALGSTLESRVDTARGTPRRPMRPAWTGAVYYGVAHTAYYPATVAMVAVCHFTFNFGANTLTFVMPAEIFPTCYRCTCHGISAAAGKTGSVLALLAVYGINAGYMKFSKEQRWLPF